MQFIEGMVKAFLSLLLATDEVNIVNKQHARVPVPVAKFLRISLPDGADKLVGELLGAGADERHMMGKGNVSDGMEQMRFTQTDTTVDEQRIVGASRVLAHGESSGAGQAIPAPFDERLEVVTRVELGSTHQRGR